MKFSEKVRDNLERFKDRIEKIGKKAIILGAIGASIGCASNGKIATNSTTYYTADQVLRGEITLDEYIMNADPYDFCYTREDSIKRVGVYWYRLTGSPDPLMWEKLIKEDSMKFFNPEMRTSPKDGIYYSGYLLEREYIDILIQRAKEKVRNQTKE